MALVALDSLGKGTGDISGGRNERERMRIGKSHVTGGGSLRLISFVSRVQNHTEVWNRDSDAYKLWDIGQLLSQ